MRTEVWNFLRQHGRHLLVLVFPGSVLVTLIHEAAHALAVLAYGGAVTQFVWLPTAGHWGFVRFRLPPGSPDAPIAVALAPYGFWMLLAALAGAIAVAGVELRVWARRFFFIWCFAVPLGDIGNTAFGYLAGDPNDFFAAFGSATTVGWVAIVSTAVVALVVGFFVQRRLYREEALQLPAYGFLGSVALLAIVAVNTHW